MSCACTKILISIFIGVKAFPVGDLWFPELALLLAKQPITDVVGQEQLSETSDDYFSCKCKQDQNVLYNSEAVHF